MFTRIRSGLITGALCLSAALAAGCAAPAPDTTTTAAQTDAVTQADTAAQAALSENVTDNKIKIVCTIFPEYDWVRQILGDNMPDAEVDYLLGSGVDLHS